MVDLHIHTNLSDGTDSVAELIGKIEGGGFRVFSVTDHDNLRANLIIKQDWLEYLRQRNIRFISGIELSADYNGKSISSYFDLKIFVETSDDVRLARRILRDMNSRGRSLERILHQYRDGPDRYACHCRCHLGCLARL